MDANTNNSGLVVTNELDIQENIAQKKELLLKLKDDISLFGRVCFPTALNKATPPFHKDIYKAIKDEKNGRVLIAAPRGNA